MRPRILRNASGQFFVGGAGAATDGGSRRKICNPILSELTGLPRGDHPAGLGVTQITFDGLNRP
jgi:hypothetical protein